VVERLPSKRKALGQSSAPENKKQKTKNKQIKKQQKRKKQTKNPKQTNKQTNKQTKNLSWKLQKLINTFSKVAGNKFNRKKKSLNPLYKMTNGIEKEIRETRPSK